jgi:hypothetical protein
VIAPQPLPVRGIWLLASHVAGRPVCTDDPYPHVCGWTGPGLMTGAPVRLDRRGCGACAKATAKT